MMKYSLTKVETAIGAAIAVGDLLLMQGDPVKQVVGYAILSGISAYFGKHFISNALAAEKEIAAAPVKPN
jgi:membrane protein implicated in regulation of membrane protease activity